MVIDWMYGAASQSGWWMGPYSTGGDSHEGILRNTGALKNGISMLGEARAGAGHDPPGRGRHATRARTRTARPTRTCGRTGRACGTSPPSSTRSWRSTRRPRPTSRRRHGRPDGPARLLPVAADAERRREPERPAGRRHAARVAHPRPGPVRLLHHAGRLRHAADEHRARRRSSAGSVAERLAIHGIKVEPWGQRRARAAQAAAARPGRPAAGRGVRAADASRRRSATTATATAGPVGGTVPATLSLTLGAPGHVRRVHAGRGQGVRRRHRRDRHLDGR